MQHRERERANVVSVAGYGKGCVVDVGEERGQWENKAKKKKKKCA